MNNLTWLFNWYKGLGQKSLPVIPLNQHLPPPAPTHMGRIQVWARAIQHQEGGRPNDRNLKNNNPGNLRWSGYTKTLKPIGKDCDNFCIFNSYADGFTALCSFLTAAANNELKPYKNCTLDQFTTIYAQPPNKNYANAVAKSLNVKVDVLIKQLL